ncbi:MAG: acyl-CoA dehydrogenase [Rhodospirillaceae bacterium]|jgi:alkylation response protein AidB-like acyl-CoA dehydrogenase|nr:acyl-CoA dehydrogenase [Rhodospirillales bacterium]MBT3905195.1 acyl-CoA dehydrogenase [Rhodospirillaceae bacterium]MBT4701633.1 acyl-CoA dehydrogenase [Rhodospirillaceae bacterium]MBT5035779.1 acyl-CoA dehydrogenase [Rhodospirillaceae bacterium]MBT6218782.1 acyl-CoA dehydrogenase [Rhodospirillaceae bacterium]
MSTYAAPLADQMFLMNEVLDLGEIAALPGYEDATPDLVSAILEEAGKFGAEVLAPLNQSGDEQGCSFENGVVRTPDGFANAYAQFVETGWNSLGAPTDYDGQGMPTLVSTAVSEIWHGANMSFGLCPLLNQGGIEALTAHGSDALKTTYLPKMVSGEWPSTMNLTESQAGSDLAQINTKSVRDGEHYKITGQKIFISYGEHDMAANIVHLVLARSPDGPEGIKGLSLFLVPKVLANDDASLGERNDLRCVSIEHKLGLKASPTAVMSFGDDGGAVGYLIGEENHGIKNMFTMMNNTRLSVGLQGVAVAERAYQRALAYAKERIQGHDAASDNVSSAPIIRHPDVRRMLMAMKTQTEATRAVAYYMASCLDFAHRHPDENIRQANQAMADLLTPVVKAWSTDTGAAVADLGIQVHGGMGYIEETGAAQHFRDVRVTAIYEGTNGIQAADLVGRKVARENAESVKALIKLIKDDLEGFNSDNAHLSNAVNALSNATDWIISTYPTAPQHVAAGAVHYTRMLGLTMGGWLMAKAASKAFELTNAGTGNPEFLEAKILSARFFADQYVSQVPAILELVKSGANSLKNVRDEHF